LLDGSGKPPIGDAVVDKQSLHGSPAFHEPTRAELVDRNAEIPPGRAQLGDDPTISSQATASAVRRA
jgi:hypothetical protein